MGDNFSRYEQWAAAQATAFASEQRVAAAALRQAAGAGLPPSMTDLQGALILRGKASALLSEMVAVAADAPGEFDGIAVTPRAHPSHVGS